MSLNSQWLADSFRSNGNLKPAAPRLARLLAPVIETEQRAMLTTEDLSMAYVGFNYTPVPMVERAWPGDLMPEAPAPVPVSYWLEQASIFHHVPPLVGRSHAHVAAKRTGRVTFGTEALKRAAQAKVRALMDARSATRRSEWHALAQVKV
jgi:hypothetical protein